MLSSPSNCLHRASDRPGARRRLTLLLAIAAAFLLVPAASAFAKTAAVEVVFAGSGSGLVEGEAGKEGGEPHLKCHWNGTAIDEGTPEPGKCKTTAVEVEPGLVGIVVIAKEDPGSEFAGWAIEEEKGVPLCEEGNPKEKSCGVLSFGTPIKIKATFEPIPKLKLTIAHTGTGSGQVNCEVNGEPALDEPCEKEYEKGTELKLIAAEGAHSTFKGFEAGSGDASACSTSPCGPFALKKDSGLDARFDLIPHTLTVEPTGEGSVGADSGAIAGCKESGGTCSGAYGESEAVTLIATPGEHKVVEWEGCDSEPSTTKCEVLIPAGDAAVKAKFVTAPVRTVTVEASGEGSVSAAEPPVSLSGEIASCTETGGECSADYYQGDTVTLMATPGAHKKTVWTSGCDNVPSADECEVEVDGAPVSVEVEFVQITHTLTVATAGAGSGTVSCDGGACAASYPEGATVTLSATAASGSTFGGWSGGGCSGGGTCAVTIGADTTVTATFDAITQPRPNPPPEPEQKGTAIAKGVAQVKGNVALLELSCAGGGDCEGSLKLIVKVKRGKKSESKVVGRASFSIAAGKSNEVRVKIGDGQVKKTLAQGKAVKAKLQGSSLRSRTVKLEP